MIDPRDMEIEELVEIVRPLPKVELHLHHEGAAPPEFIRRLASEQKVNLSHIFREDGSYDYRDFVHFLSVYEAATSVLKGPKEFYRLTAELLRICAENDVVYVETFLSPDFCGGGDLNAWRDYLAAMIEAAQEAEAEHGIIWRGIPTCIRHFGPEQAKSAAICTAETAGDYIVGFGMGGNESIGRQRDYAWAFDCAREAGVHLTTHAGEWGGAKSVREAITDLPAVARIGHGVQAIDDPKLIADIIARDIVLEVCPGSNVFLGVYPSLEKHPIQRLRDAGVKVTVSTDDPPFFHTNMRLEYENLARTLRWGPDDFRALNQTAIDAAFCSEDIREAVRKRLT